MEERNNLSQKEVGEVYDLAIIGAGPAGMFAGLEATKYQSVLKKVIIIEQGPIRSAIKPEDGIISTKCWGGAGTISDCKLGVSSRVGGRLGYLLGRNSFMELKDYVISVYEKFGGAGRYIDPTASEHQEFVKGLKKQAEEVNIKILEYPIIHLGTEGGYLVSKNIREYLQSQGVEISVNTRVKRINPLAGHLFSIEAESVISSKPCQFFAKNVIAAPGRVGLEEWFMDEIKRLKIPFEVGPVDIGARIEVEAATLKEITDIFHEIKFYFKSSKYYSPYYKTSAKTRSFCMCPYGSVVMERYRDLALVNGHSFKGSRSENTNFAIMIKERPTRPLNDPVAYGRAFALPANQLAGGGILVQRLEDLRAGHRSYSADLPDQNWKIESTLLDWKIRPTLRDAVRGDLGRAIPHRYLNLILETLEAMDKIMPGVNGPDTLLYVPEVKFYSIVVAADPEKGFETGIRGLYVAGDGSGYTGGLLQSSMMGVIVARAIAKNLIV